MLPEHNIVAVNHSDGNEIYNGLGDLDYLVDPSNAGFNNATGCNTIPMVVGDDNMPFLELNDLNTPLSSFAPYSGYDVFGQFGSEDNSFCGAAAQNAFGLYQLPPLPESLGNYSDLLKVTLRNVLVFTVSFTLSLSHSLSVYTYIYISHVHGYIYMLPWKRNSPIKLLTELSFLDCKSV